MKPGKYAGKSFTPEQQQARRMSQRALTMRVRLSDVLMTTPDRKSRQDWHKRLDWYLDRMDNLQAEAEKIFPDVDESFVIAREEIRL